MNVRMWMPVCLAAANVCVFSLDAYAQEWKVAHWNALHGWGRYWDKQISPPEQDAGDLYPPDGPFTAISDDGGGPDGFTYDIDTDEPPSSAGCNTAPYVATWNHPAAPMQNLLMSAQVAGDPALVAVTLSEARYCISESEVKAALAAGHSSWNNATFARNILGSARGDAIIAKHGWVDGQAPTLTLWHQTNNEEGDVLLIAGCSSETKYHVLHGYIYTDANETTEKAVHLFATRLQGLNNTCETNQLDAFVQAKAGPNGRVLVIGDFNFQSGSSGYNNLIAKQYEEAGSSDDIPAGNTDKSAKTCCFGSDNGLSNGQSLSTRIDMAFYRNLPDPTTYWLGNKTVLNPTDEVAMSDHAMVKVGFPDGGDPPDPGPWTVTDTFDDNTLDPAIWVSDNLFSGARDAGIPVNERNQRLEIGPLPLNDSGYNGIRTQPRDFRGAYAQIRLVQRQAPTSTAYAMFTVGDGDTHYRFYTFGTTLVCEEKVNSVKTTPSPCSVAYSATSHQFLRISHDSATGEAVWEAAPAIGNEPGAWIPLARRTWSTQYLPLTGVMFELKAGSSSSETVAPGTVVFDSFVASNAPEDSEVVLLEDDFGDDTLGAGWHANVFSGATDTSIPVDETNQRLEVGPLPLNDSGYNGIRSDAKSFTGGYAYVRLVQAQNPASTAYAMYTVGDGDTHFRFYVFGSTLVCEAKVNNVKTTPPACSVAYSPSAHQFLQIKHDSATGEAVWEAAPANGSGPGSWTPLGRAPWNTTYLPLTSVMFELKAGSSSNETVAPGTIVFDTFKAARPQ
jgi:hypothetical protein